MSHPLQSFHSSCNNVSGAFSSSSSSSSSSPCSSTVSSPDSPTPSGSSSAYQTELCPTAESCGGARLKPSLASHHKRSVSMTSLPVYNRQVADSCIVRVSVDMRQSNGNMYKSILVSWSSSVHYLKPYQWWKHNYSSVMCLPANFWVIVRSGEYACPATFLHFLPTPFTWHIW